MWGFDPGFTGPKFTWCNNHKQQDRIWERLDRFFINVEMQNRCDKFKVSHLPPMASDHRPLLGEWQEDTISDTGANRKRPKRFEEVWKKYDGCREIVEQVWNVRDKQTRKSIMEKTSKCILRLN